MPPSDGLDELDSRLLYELDLHSRQPLSKLAKKLRVSVQRLDYRLRALERKGVIIGYPTLIDLCKLGGYQYFACFIRTYHMSSREQDEYLRLIAKDDECTLAYSAEGAWDMIVGTVAKNVFEAKTILSRLLAPIARSIREKTVYTDMRIYHYGRHYMMEPKKGQAEARAGGTFNERKRLYRVIGEMVEPVSHSELDIDILHVLAADARTPSVKIAKLTGTSPETVVHHIRRMEREGIIESYGTLLNPSKYGYQFNRVMIQLASMEETRLHEISEYIKRFPKVFRLIELFEVDGFMIDFLSRTFDETEYILSEFRDHYREHIDDIKMARITRIYKAVYFPTFGKGAKN